jgi:hypothetical protein
MATLGTNVLTLADWAKRVDPDGKIAVVAELLSQTNAVVQDMAVVEANNNTGHRLTVRTGLPTPAWRLLNQGVQPSKSTTAQIDEATGILEAWSEVDKDLAELNGNVNQFRMDEAKPFTEAMSQEMVQTLFYGNQTTAQQEFTGLSPRYSSTSADIGQNIIAGGGSGSDNSSIWLICWSPQTVFTIFPKGSQAGLTHEDLGLGVIESTAGVAGQRLLGYRERWQWKVGLAVKDWRYAVRIPNIDISALLAKTSAADLIDLMIQAIHRIPNLNAGKCAFYMNRTCYQMLDIQRYDNVAAAGLRYENVDGQLIPHFRGIPIRLVDQLTQAETLVS